jgi:hypothetical protein
LDVDHRRGGHLESFGMRAFVQRAWVGSALGLAAGLGAPNTARADCDRPAAVRFPAGVFVAELTGGVPRGERDCFTIGAGAGQVMSVTQRPSLDDNIVFQLYQPGWKITRGPDGTDVSGATLRGAGEGDDARTWSGRLQAKGDYLIVVGTTRGGGEYRIRIEIR